MVTVSVAELKAKLSEYLRRVKAGEQVIVSDRGRAVAVLGPPPKASADDARLQRLADAGLVRLGRGISDDVIGAPVGDDPGDRLLGFVLEEREEAL